MIILLLAIEHTANKMRDIIRPHITLILLVFIDGRIIEKGIELAAVISAHKSGEQVNEAGLSFSGFTIRSNGLKLVIKIYSPG